MLTCVALGSTGCADKLRAKSVQAASLDFPCDAEQIQLDPEFEKALGADYIAYGCGWEAKYEARCSLFGCGASTTARLDAAANQSNRNARLSQLKYQCDKEFKETSCKAYERERLNPGGAATGTGHPVPGVRPSSR